MTHEQQPDRSVRTFVAGLFASSVPFWIAGGLVDRFIPEGFPIDLPVSALMTFNPMLAALILVYRAEGQDGVAAFLKQAFDARRIPPRWLIPIFTFVPLAMWLEVKLARWRGDDLPEAGIRARVVAAMFLVFSIAAAGEELGWQGYAFEPLQARWGERRASLLLGIVWAVWHMIPFYQARHDLAWTFWQSVTAVGLRVLIVWLYLRTGRSVLAAILFHAMINVSNFLYPRYGSHYDPFLAAILIGSAAVAVMALWRPTSLPRVPSPAIA
jgi:membrane protease YdiL (CAAX protease family)